MYNKEQDRWNTVQRTHWWGRGHYATVRALIAGFLGEREKKSLRCLDIGCSGGLITDFMKQYGQVYGFDISLDGLLYCADRSFIVQADATQIPFKDGSFDVVTILDVAEHIDDDALLFQEVYRVARENAAVFITVPAFSFFWRSHDLRYGHKRRYTRAELERLARNHLFTIKKVIYLHAHLAVPLLFSALFDKLDPKHYGKRDDFINGGVFLDSLLLKTLLLEHRLLKYITFPFGISLFGILHK